MTKQKHDLDLDELVYDERRLSPCAIADDRVEDIAARGARQAGGRGRTQRDVMPGAEWTTPFVDTKT